MNEIELAHNGATRARIAILICTCDRLSLLQTLLEALTSEVHSSAYGLAVVAITDNGSVSAESVVEMFADRLPIQYERILEPGVTVARNASLKLALATEPDYLAFIDDDEIPQSGWLENLVSALITTEADFATGPVLPIFVNEPPSWLADYFRKSGHDFCTSNLILRSSAIPSDPQQWFNMIFNRSGGEDLEFLTRLASNGARHSVAVSAWVSETIPTERLSIGYLWKLGLRDGVVKSNMNRLRATNAFEYTRLSAWLIMRKLAFCINHLVWSAGSMPRLYRAADDLAVAIGALVNMFGYTINLYGRDRN